MSGSILRTTVLSVVGTCLLIPYGINAQCTPEPSTVVQGTALLETPDGPAYAPRAKVIIQGDFLMVSAITDPEGKFRFSNLEPGTYTLKATYFGLYAEPKISDADQGGFPVPRLNSGGAHRARPGAVDGSGERSATLRGIGIQEWLSFYFKSPMTAPGLSPEHNLFIHSTKLNNTLRHLMGAEMIIHLGLDYQDSFQSQEHDYARI